MPKTEKTEDFSALFSELEELVAWFDEDHVDIDTSLKKFERGMELAEKLKKHLNEAENKVTKIKAQFDIG